VWNQPIKELEKPDLDQMTQSVPFMVVISIMFLMPSESLLIIKAMKNYDQNATFVKMRLSVALALDFSVTPTKIATKPTILFYRLHNSH